MNQELYNKEEKLKDCKERAQKLIGKLDAYSEDFRFTLWSLNNVQSTIVALEEEINSMKAKF